MTRICEEIRELGMDCDRYIDRAADHVGVPPRDIRAVGVLKYLPDGVGPLQLARRLGLSAPATTALVGRMQRAGHVTREGHDLDARRVRIQLTPSAYRTSSTIFAPMNQEMHRALREFDDEQLETFLAILLRLRSATHEAMHQELPAVPE